MKRKIAEIRANKKTCDFDTWKGPYFQSACLDYDDCVGCGAFGNETKRIENLIVDLKKQHLQSKQHIRKFLQQYDDGLIFDLATLLLSKHQSRSTKKTGTKKTGGTVDGV